VTPAGSIWSIRPTSTTATTGHFATGLRSGPRALHTAERRFRWKNGARLAELVSANYFDLLKVKPVLGRCFLAGERREQEGGAPVAVISYGMWRTRFGGDPKVLGKVIR